MRDSNGNNEAQDKAVFVRGDGVDIACHVAGPSGAPVLVFVHGYPDNHEVWDRLVTELACDYRCVRYDVRGAGESSRPAQTSAYTLNHLEADLKAVVDWASPDAPVHLIGHDWGSIQTWEAVTNPALAERIASYTSISGPCLDHVGHWLRSQWRDDRAGLLKQMRKSWYILAFHVPLVPGLLWHSVLGRRWPAIAKRMEGHALPENPTQTRDGAIGIRLYRANILERLRHPRERYAQAPVQVITPQRDPFVGPGFVVGLERWVESLTVTPIDAAHWAMQTHPQTIAAHCREFVASHSEKKPSTPRQESTGARARPQA
ncbi:short chain dehydrogenase [Salinisphaera dokdonensis CL-ES53]|uniref:Short chain dehydrogenase n=1 Tax=Salinisphaera dokdonensis CL-ES53 TaxID=1304272 RepID=A0ABV2B1B2_9GAMM